MKQILLLLLFCHVSSAVKHSLKFFVTASTGVPNIPEFMGAALVDGTLMGYCDSNRKIAEPKQDWSKEFLENNPQHTERYYEECFEFLPNLFKTTIHSLKERFNKTGGIHVLQRMYGCELDDRTGEVNGIMQYGYNGEDFISLDLKTLTWIAPKPQAFITKLRWDTERAAMKFNENYLTQVCPEWLKDYVAFGKRFMLRRELPSVSLLQKTPSSPVSCHATGFYPDRAMMYWRKDGEEHHEDVDHGEILPNHDGTFQMSVDLNVSSVAPEDWRRYDCVFHLSGVEDDIVTRLDDDVIMSNREKPSDKTVSITAAVFVLALILIAAAGSIIYKKKKAKCPPPCFASPGHMLLLASGYTLHPLHKDERLETSRMQQNKKTQEEGRVSDSAHF